MKQLDSSVLHAMDLDVPRNVLLFSVVIPPQHGSIVDHGDKPVSRRREAEFHSTVVDFTMTDLSNGTMLCSSQAYFLWVLLRTHGFILVACRNESDVHAR